MIRFRAFGVCDLRGDDATELRAILTQPRPLALLAYIALARPRGFQRRDTLLALLWPELGEDAARNALRQTVHRLRKAMGEGVLEGRGAGELGLNPGRLTSDVADFERALDAGNAAEGLDLYRGDLLPGFHVGDAPEFERWLDSERDRLRRRAVAVAWDMADDAARDGRAADAGHWARRAAELTPDDEASVQRLIRMLVAGGDRAGAVRAYDSYARRAAEDYGDEPSAETRALIAPLKAPVPFAVTTPALSADPVVAPAAQPAALVTATAAPAAPSRVGATPSPRRLRWLTVAILAASAAIALTIRFAWPRRPPAPRTLAVFPFVVRGSPELAYLSDGMVDLLSAKLDGAAGFRTLDPRSVIAAARRGDASAAEASPAPVAGRLGASWYIRGDVVEIAGRLQVSAKLFSRDAGERAVTTATVSGEVDSVFALVDELTGRILADQTTGRDTALTRLAALTTRSLPALKEFLRGERLMRAGLDAQSAAAFREAIALDSTFALAQYRFAVAATWATLPDVRDPTIWARRAAQHAERLTPVARDLVNAYVAYRSLRADSAEALFRAATEGHPEYAEAWFMLGETWFHMNSFRGRSPMEAWPAFERVLALDPANPHALVHLARLAALSGRADALDSIARQYAESHHDAERSIEIRALRAYVRGDGPEMAAVMEAVPATDDYTVIGVLLAALPYAQDLDAARGLAPALARVSEPVSRAISRRIYTDLPLDGARWAGAGREAGLVREDADWGLETRALQASERFFPLSPGEVRALRDSISARGTYAFRSITGAVTPGAGEPMREYLLALLSVRLGDTAGAGVHLRRLQAAAVGDTSVRFALARSMAHSVAAELARSSGDFTRALRELEEFDPSWWPLMAHWGIRERFLRAEALHALGRDDEALPLYESFASSYDVPWMAPAHFRAAEIQAKRGNREQALFHYDRFISLWKDGDAAVRPLLARAEAAASALRTP